MLVETVKRFELSHRFSQGQGKSRACTFTRSIYNVSMISFSYSHTAEFAPASDQFRADEARARRRVLSESFNGAAQNFDEATENARKMVEALEAKGILLKTVSR